MKAVIILGHGSRIPDAGKDMEKVATILKDKYALDMVKSCYLSRLGPNFPQTLEACVSEGAKEVIVIPYFLNMGQHIRKDIPQIMQEEAIKYPNIKLIYGKHLGFDDAFADIIFKRIQESSQFNDVRIIDF